MAILTTEFPWIFALASLLLFFVAFRCRRHRVAGMTFSFAALVIYMLPVIQAGQISRNLSHQLDAAFHIQSPNEGKPFNFVRMLPLPAKERAYKVLPFDAAHNLSLDYYPAAEQGLHPCVVVIHGGSWKGGDSRQLPELNSILAQQGYNVAAVNYRKAPGYHSPTQLEDVRTAMHYLHANAGTLHIDTSKFVLLGRSAGGQLALLAAYTFRNMGIRGVISYYGPADMVWGYKHPSNPMVYNSCEVLEDYIGGSYDQVPEAYIESSPIEAVSATSVPTLLIHGKNDVLVSYYHSPRLVSRLNKYHVPNYLLTLPSATHGCDYTLKGPSGQLATYAVERFLTACLER